MRGSAWPRRCRSHQFETRLRFPYQLLHQLPPQRQQVLPHRRRLSLSLSSSFSLLLSRRPLRRKPHLLQWQLSYL